MGCSSSKNVVSPTVTNNNVMKDEEINNHTGVVHSPRKGGHIKTSDKKPSPTVPVKLPANNELAKASVAFDVSLDGTKMDKNSLIMKHPPKKFQRLEPLNHPVFSTEMLLEKQRQAEEKRKAALQKKREVSQKTSRRRRDLVRAREFEEKQSSQQVGEQIDEQLKAAEKMRAARQRTIVERQQLREERAKRVRRKAKKLNDPDELEIPDIEADETYLDDDDSFTWDDGVESYYGDVSSLDPVKRAQNNPRHITSASTIDSVDNAFLNKPHSASLSHTNKIQHDDFFDT